MQNILVTGANRGLGLGWVQGMTQQTGLIDVETSVSGLVTVIDNIQNYPPGAFVAFDGTLVPY